MTDSAGRGWAHEFEDFGGVTYLNCAYQGPLPRVSIEAAHEALQRKAAPFQISDRDYFDAPDAYRAAVGRLIHADPLHVAVTDSTTHGVMLLVHGLDWNDGDEVVLPAGEFPANRFPWKSLEKRGVVIKEVDLPSAAGAAEALERAMTPRTRVVSMAWVSYQSGERRDVRALGEVARAGGALFVIDGSQAIGGVPFDLSGTPCDLLACSGYKWMLGPYGLGFAWVEPQLGERLEVANVNWFAVKGARDFNRLGECHQLEFEPGARRFDINETANLVNLGAGIASLQLLERITIEAAERHVRGLLDRFVAGLPAGFRPRTEIDEKTRSNILCLVTDSEELSTAAGRELDALGVAVSRREASIRLSPFVYNTDADIDRCLEALSRATGAERGAVSVASAPIGEPVADAVVGRPAQRPCAAIRRFGLRPINPESDVGDLYEPTHGSPERDAVWTYLGYGPFADAAAMRAWLEERAASSDPLFFTVVDQETSRAVGVVSYLRIEPTMRCLEIGHIWYIPQMQGARANPEITYLLLREAFALGYRRVEWKCNALNRRSRRAALRLGFQFEGVFRQHLISKGRNRDTAWYAMLDRDWPQVRKRFEAWLSADDPQATPLSAGDPPVFRAPPRG